VRIGDITLGGQPGEFPTVLIGSIFYDRHRIVKDPKKGKFEEAEALELIHSLEEVSDKTGNPFMLDVVGTTPEALKRFIEFVGDSCEAPFLVDSTSVTARVAAMEHAIEIGLEARSVYNSIDYATKEEELSSINEIGVKHAIVMAFNPKDLRPEGRLRLLVGNHQTPGLLEKTRKANVENILIDTAVLDVPSIGLAARSVPVLKEQLGLPCGCAPSNAVATWRRCRDDYGDMGLKACQASANAIPILFGSDFILFGPVSRASEVFPVCAMADAIVAYTCRYLGTEIQTPSHPLRRIF